MARDDGNDITPEDLVERLRTLGRRERARARAQALLEAAAPALGTFTPANDALVRRIQTGLLSDDTYAPTIEDLAQLDWIARLAPGLLKDQAQRR